MEGFITWSILKEYVSFVAITFMVVEFCKGLPVISKIPTKYFSSAIAFVLLILVNMYNKTFTYLDITLYLLSAISISLGSNGLYHFNNSVKNIDDMSDDKKLNSNVIDGVQFDRSDMRGE